MKIAIFLPFFSSEHNGIKNYVIEFYSHLSKKKTDLKLYIITFDTERTNNLKSEEGIFIVYRIPCYILLGGTYVIPSFKGLKVFWKIVKSEQFNFVNTHTRFFISSLLGLIMAKKQHIPLWHTEHGSSFVKDGSLFTRLVARIYDELFGRLVISSATKLFGVSEACLKFTRKLGGKNGSVIYNCIDSAYWNAPEREPNIVIKITFCGRMVQGKGVQNLLQALAKLKHLEWELHLIGNGNYSNVLKELAAKLELNNKIFWHGSQNREFLKELLLTTDIFVNPSYTEGLPTSVLEAGAMRCAIIATNVGGTNEIIDNQLNGILVPISTERPIVNSLTFSIQTLLSNHELQRKYGNSINQKIKEKFSWNVIVTDFIKNILE